MAQIGDNIVMVQVSESDHPDSTGQDILLWNYQDAIPQIVGEIERSGGRPHAVRAVISGRFFPECKPNLKIRFKADSKLSSNCIEAYKTLGFISPKSSNAVKVLMASGSTTECEFENLYEQTKKCPNGWTGKADDESCYKIETFPATNDEAAQFCNQEGAELIQIESSDEDDMINEILFGHTDYSTPTHPGFYHIGTYQRQSSNQYYHRNGVRV